MFMAIVSLALLVYLTADSQSMEMAERILVCFMVAPKFTVPLIIVVIAIPVAVAWKAYSDASKLPQPPVSSRTIHPPPPSEIQYKGKRIDLVNGENPFRELENSDPDRFQQHVENGRTIYYKNCVFCHGDDMAGKGNLCSWF